MKRVYLLLPVFLFCVDTAVRAQDARVDAKIDAVEVMVGDQVRLFIEAKHNPKQGRLEWASIPDTFNKLEVVEKGKIDTIIAGDIVTLKQRLLISGYDSGMFTIPPIAFTAVPNNGSPYVLSTDSFRILVQTVPVDTTQPFKGIKEIMTVKTTWLDYLWYIIGVIIFIILLVVVILYFIRNRKASPPVIVPSGPVETLTEKTLRLLTELEDKQLWEQGNVKEYYIELTDILRTYIEERFRTRALELTTDEILQQARKHKEMVRHIDLLRTTLETADLAKFAKAEPLPQEHMDAMELTRQFIKVTKPVIKETPTQS